MGIITVSGQTGCRYEEVARLCAKRLSFDLVTETRLAHAIEDELGADVQIPDRAYSDVAASILARSALQNHLLIAADGAETLFKDIPGVLRAYVVAPEKYRAGAWMLEHRVDRPIALARLRASDKERREKRRKRFGRGSPAPEAFDIVLNAERLETEQMASVIERAAVDLAIEAQGHLSAATEMQLQFQMRLRLAKHGISPPGRVSLEKKAFAHPSEEIFANLLDFYRIAWTYEPKSFPIEWDESGRVTEAFTPDFYLSEFDLYVELTTMKQSLVTKKNRKVKRLRELYPGTNIQVFYQKDFENLIFKYGLADRLTPA